MDVYLVRRSYWDAFREFLAGLGLGAEAAAGVEAFARGKAADAERRTLFDGVAETLAQLKSDGVRLAVLSDTESSEAVVRRRLAQLGIEQCFEAVVTSVDIGHVKPQPEAFAAVLDRLHATPAESMFVGHDADELEGAKRSGLTAVAFNHENGVAADYYLDRFSDLPRLVGPSSADDPSAPVVTPIDSSPIGEMGSSAVLARELKVPEKAAPPAARRSFLFLAGSLAGGNIISLVFRTIGTVVQGRCVGPDVLGPFVTVGIVLGYIPFLPLGIPNGLNRELPYYIGTGDRKRAYELASAAQAWVLTVSLVATVLLLLVSGWCLARGEMWLAAAWATDAILAFLTLYGASYLQVTYRTGHDFARLALANVIQNVAGLVLVVLVVLWGFYGICLRTLLSTALGFAVLYYWRPFHVGARWNVEQLKHLLVIGMPIFGVGILYAWWPTLNLTLVAWFTDAKSVGLYYYVILAGGTLEMLPNAVSQIIYPRMAEHYGRTGRHRDLVRMAKKPIALTRWGWFPSLWCRGSWWSRSCASSCRPMLTPCRPCGGRCWCRW